MGLSERETTAMASQCQKAPPVLTTWQVESVSAALRCQQSQLLPGITCEVDHSGGDDGGSGSPFVCLLLLLLLLRYFVAFTGLELTSSSG